MSSDRAPHRARIHSERHASSKNASRENISSDNISSEYEDNLLDRLFISLFCRKMARATGTRTPLTGYDGFVDLSQRIAQHRSPQEQQAAIAQVLRSLVPAPVLWTIRTVFSPTQRICEWNAWFATQLFEWLVGPCEVAEAIVTGADGQTRSQTSGVHISKCRYLERSGCVGACVNLCKIPTQTFFTQEFGIPVTMTPNFEDFSCDMVFGQVPPQPTEDPVYQQPCTAGRCPTARPAAATCPSVR
ncbi:MAG: beta-carotene isomerase domain-containing protein [Cyanobacteria bacterium P01_D01_bin.123]